MPQNRFIAKSAWATLYYVRKVFFEAGITCASSFTDVELNSSGAINDVYNVVRQAVELFREFRQYFN